MSGEIPRQSLYGEFRHSLLNDLQVLLGAVQLGKADTDLVALIERALARIDEVRAALTEEEENNDVCR